MGGMANFAAEIRNNGVAKESHFRCEIFPPKSMNNNSVSLVSRLEFYIESVQLPEFALATMPTKDNGLTREVVYDKMYGAITPVFICDQNMEVKRFFDSWLEKIVMNNGGVFDYPDNYMSKGIKIEQLNAQKEVVYSVEFKNAYPKIVNDAYLSAKGRDYLTFQVQFVYESWKSILTEREKLDRSKKIILPNTDPKTWLRT